MVKLESITIEKNEEYLRQISKEVDINDPEIHNNIVVLQDFCMQNEVFAMAAVQLGIPKRIVYVKNTDLNKSAVAEGKDENKDYNEAKVMINPEIISKEGLTTFWEACASSSWYEKGVKKWYSGKVKRPYKIKVKYIDVDGIQHIDDIEGFPSTILCHEIDHLDGILHIDVADEVLKQTKEERLELRKRDGYTIISRTGDYEELSK
ncbi:MAG: peptide deformylase [Clostridia bacterium]|nr:peptide deformylase [Clostridia bacterium]